MNLYVLLGGALIAAARGFAGGWKLRDLGATAALATKEAAWDRERTKAAELSGQALRSEIAAHNRTRNELEADHANAEAQRAVAVSQAASAAAVAAAARRESGGLRDAIESNRLHTAAALEAAGAAGQCQAATQAADLLRGVLGRVDAAASRLADGAQAISGDADTQFSAASECAAAAGTMIRNSGR